MKVILFDECHEKDLEEDINNFLQKDIEVIDIKYSVAMMIDPRSLDQIYSFSCMIVYNDYISNDEHRYNKRK